MKYDFTDRRVDGGYGWIIVLSSFCLLVIADGILYSFGNLMVELIEEFNTDRATTALMGSILLGVSGLIGPFGGGLCDRYGCRVVAVVGSFLSCIGILISTFARRLYVLYIFYGLVAGIGLGCIFLVGNILSVQYFSKRRGLAYGTTFCGSGVGIFVFNQLTRVLINEYGWRGTLLIEAGMCLQCLVFSLLLLPPLQEEKINPTSCYDNETVNTNHLENGSNANNIELNNTENIYVISNVHAYHTDNVIQENSSAIQTESTQPGSNNNEDKKEIHKTSWTVWLKQLFQLIFDTELLTDLRFWIFLLSTVFMSLAMSVSITMTADRAIESGMTKDEASWLASSIGIASTISRVFLGWFADRQVVSRVVMASVLLFLAGISLALSCLLRAFTTRMVGMSLYGIFIGGYTGICPLVLADLFSSELIAKSFGFYLFAFGLSSIAATPIGGHLFDKTGKYDVTFVVAGSEMIIAGLLVLVLRFIPIKRKKMLTHCLLHEIESLYWKWNTWT